MCLFRPYYLITRFLPKKSFRSTWRFYTAVTSCKESEIFHMMIFHKTWKTSFVLKAPRKDFFQKFKFHYLLTSCKKSENSHERFRTKKLRTNGQTDKRANGQTHEEYFVGFSLHGSNREAAVHRCFSK